MSVNLNTYVPDTSSFITESELKTDLSSYITNSVCSTGADNNGVVCYTSSGNIMSQFFTSIPNTPMIFQSRVPVFAFASNSTSGWDSTVLVLNDNLGTQKSVIGCGTGVYGTTIQDGSLNYKMNILPGANGNIYLNAGSGTIGMTGSLAITGQILSYNGMTPSNNGYSTNMFPVLVYSNVLTGQTTNTTISSYTTPSGGGVAGGRMISFKCLIDMTAWSSGNMIVTITWVDPVTSNTITGQLSGIIVGFSQSSTTIGRVGQFNVFDFPIYVKNNSAITFVTSSLTTGTYTSAVFIYMT